MLQSVIFFLPYVAHGNTHCDANLWSWRAVCQRGPTCDLQRGRELCGRWRPTSCFVFTSSTRRSLFAVCLFADVKHGSNGLAQADACFMFMAASSEATESEDLQMPVLGTGEEL